MPKLSAWMLRAALLYLLAGFTAGALILMSKGTRLVPPAVWALLPTHIEFLLSGWTLQLALGTAYWIFPRFGRGAGRGQTWPAWLGFALLNAGIWLAILGPHAGAAWWRPLGRAAELGGVVAFGLHLWPRVRPTRG